MIGVGCIFQDAVGSVEAAGPVDVLQRGRGESNDILCCFDDFGDFCSLPLKQSFVSYGDSLIKLLLCITFIFINYSNLC